MTANVDTPTDDAPFPDEITVCRPAAGHDLEVVDWPPPDDSRAYERYIRRDLRTPTQEVPRVD